MNHCFAHNKFVCTSSLRNGIFVAHVMCHYRSRPNRYVLESLVWMLFFSSGWAQSPKDFKVVRSDTIADGSIVFHHREDVWEGAEWDASRGFSEIRLSSSGKNVRLIDTIEIVAGYFPAFPTSDRKLVLFESMGKIFLFDPVSNHSSFVARGVFPHVLSSLKEGFFYFVFDPVVSKRKKFMEGENFFAVFFGKYVGRAAKLG